MELPDIELAINEDNLAALSFEVDDYVDRISSIFEKYNTKINKLPSCYKGQSCKDILAYYEEIKKSFIVVKNNIKSYGNDYRDLIKILNSEDKKLSGILNDKSVEVANAAEKIRVNETNATIV